MKCANLVKMSPAKTTSKAASPRDYDANIGVRALDSKETSQVNVLDREAGEEEEKKEPLAPTSPAKSKRNGEEGDADEQRPLMSPSRTDTAFYDGKVQSPASKGKQKSPESK